MAERYRQLPISADLSSESFKAALSMLPQESSYRLVVSSNIDEFAKLVLATDAGDLADLHHVKLEVDPSLRDYEWFLAGSADAVGSHVGLP